jgi:hypothetical protein
MQTMYAYVTSCLGAFYMLKVVAEAYHKHILARYPSLSELSQTVMDNACRACLTVEMNQAIQRR